MSIMSCLLQSILALIFIIPGDISSLINFFNFAVWLFYGASMAALLYMRYDRPNEPRPYKVISLPSALDAELFSLYFLYI